MVCGLDQNSVYYSGSVVPSNKVWKYDPTGDNWSLWGIFPDSAIYEGVAGQANGAGYAGFGATDFNTYLLIRKFYRFGPATGSYTCNLTLNKYQISNAVYNFQANGNFSPTAQITWNFGDGHTGSGTSVIHNYTATGSYTVSVSVNDTASSCSNNATDSVLVTNINNCSVTLNSTNYGTTFTLSSTVANGAGPYHYVWSCPSDSTFSSNSPDPTVSIPVNTTTTYCVTVTDSSGCAASACKAVIDSQTYFSPCQIYLIIYPDSTLPGWYYAVLYTSGATNLTYLWDFGDGTTYTQLLPSHTYATPGRYTICLTVSDGAGCSYSFCDSAFYAYKYSGGPMIHFRAIDQITLGVKDSVDAGKIAIYPNPANAEITIEAAGQKIDNATIYNTEGQIVMTSQSLVKNKMNVSTLANGIYFIEVKGKGISSRVKFAKAN